MGRRYIARNDHLIEELLQDPNYRITETGHVWRQHGNVWVQTGKAKKRQGGGEKQYYHLKYKGQNLSIHRIVYRKFHGPLNPRRVVNHLDGNGLNNHPSNLELVSQTENMHHRFGSGSYG
jgi:hypothetical protein